MATLPSSTPNTHKERSSLAALGRWQAAAMHRLVYPPHRASHHRPCARRRGAWRPDRARGVVPGRVGAAVPHSGAGAASHISTSSTVGKRWGWARFRKLFAALRRRTARAAHEATDRGSSAAFRGAALPLIGGRGICALRARELCNGLPAAAAHTRRASWPHAASPPWRQGGGPWPRICGVGHGKGALVKEINQSPSVGGASSPEGC